LIERFGSEAKAKEISTQLEYVRRGPIWRQELTQGQAQI
jgi:hypothetical protein